jgi:uncharacterized protein YegP (UPF0339 family)
MPGKFVVRHKQGRQFHFVLVAENGQVVATSETYTTKRRCLEGIESVKRLAADASVEDERRIPSPRAGARERTSYSMQTEFAAPGWSGA